MTNLLSNALKFTHQGQITIRASCDDRAGTFAIAVQDTGIGVAPADRDRIFEDFHQVDSSTTKQFGGTGLGLAISRRLATMLGGRLFLEDTEGPGANFKLELPRRASQPANHGDRIPRSRDSSHDPATVLRAAHEPRSYGAEYGS